MLVFVVEVVWVTVLVVEPGTVDVSVVKDVDTEVVVLGLVVEPVPSQNTSGEPS